MFQMIKRCSCPRQAGWTGVHCAWYLSCLLTVLPQQAASLCRLVLQEIALRQGYAVYLTIEDGSKGQSCLRTASAAPLQWHPDKADSEAKLYQHTIAFTFSDFIMH